MPITTAMNCPCAPVNSSTTTSVQSLPIRTPTGGAGSSWAVLFVFSRFYSFLENVLDSIRRFYPIKMNYVSFGPFNALICALVGDNGRFCHYNALRQSYVIR